MRNKITHKGAKELEYEIRQIVDVAHQIEEFSNSKIYWENIGDPVQKGEVIPDWIKEIISKEVLKDATYPYSPTQGLVSTREFLIEQHKTKAHAPKLSIDDIIFFNGLGDAIATLYNLLRKEARVIGPSPSYPTHASAEAAHANCPPVTYSLVPENNWLPDLEELECKVKYNESIVAILIINPDNPTGTVFPKEVVQEMIGIARKYKLFIIADEIYKNIVFRNKKNYSPIIELIDDVPAISLQGISKEMPWPGARCGWIEVYNRNQDEQFNYYIQSIIGTKMLEVCSTTLPQKIIPQVLSQEAYGLWLEEKNAFYYRRSQEIERIFSDCHGVIAHPAQGSFFMSIVFQENGENELHRKAISQASKLSLNIKDARIRKYVQPLIQKKPGNLDFSFVYQLLGAKNICTVL